MLEALHVGRVRDVTRPHGQVDVVDLVGQVALDLVDDLATLGRVDLPPRGDQHAIELGVGHVAAIAR